LERSLVPGELEMHRAIFYCGSDYFGLNMDSFLIKARNRAHALVLFRNHVYNNSVDHKGDPIDLYEHFEDEMIDDVQEFSAQGLGENEIVDAVTVNYISTERWVS
jgi:hypothetical protein